MHPPFELHALDARVEHGCIADQFTITSRNGPLKAPGLLVEELFAGESRPEIGFHEPCGGREEHVEYAGAPIAS